MVPRTSEAGCSYPIAPLENAVYISSNKPAASAEKPNEVNVGTTALSGAGCGDRPPKNPAERLGHLFRTVLLRARKLHHRMAPSAGHQSLRCDATDIPGEIIGTLPAAP
jgi:hypothetical protein